MSDYSTVSSDEEENTKQQPEEAPTTIADDIVVTKYKMAAEITNRKNICF